MLRGSSNMDKLGNKYHNELDLLRDGLAALRRLLPDGWSVGPSRITLDLASMDALVDITAPDQRVGTLALDAKARLEPREARALVDRLRRAHLPGPPVVLSPYLGADTRARLKAAGVGYVDLTGNAHLVLSAPGLYIETHGASEDPDRTNRPARSLRGPKAGRIVRALVDRKEPPGVRELAAETGIDAGYISRVLALLDTQALITRVGHGRIQSVDWPALLRRWALEAPMSSRGDPQPHLAVRGLVALQDNLRESDERYVLTGSLAAVAFAPIAPTRLATLWLQDSTAAAERIGLLPRDVGANVLVATPGDSGPFERATKREGLWHAAPSQIAADLLTSPGRAPSEGEELIEWMMANEEKWRR